MPVSYNVQAYFEKVRKAGVVAKMQSRSLLNDYDVCVIGSYATGNVGDRAIGKSIVKNVNDTGYRSEFFSRKVRLPDCPVRILGGGQLVHDYRKGKVRRDLKLLNENSMIVGIGVSPVRDRELRELIKRTFEELPVVTVRDQRSKEILEEIVGSEVPALACPAFLLNPPEASDGCYTGLSLRPLPLRGISGEEMQQDVARNYLNYEDDVEVDEVFERYLENVNKICEEFSDLKHIPFHHTDTEFIKQFDNVSRFQYKYSVDSTLQRVANAEQMICTRYHSLVFSILANKPSIAIAYSPKVAALAERAGIPWFRPYEDIEFEFTKPSKRDAIISDARTNIDLITENIDPATLAD